MLGGDGGDGCRSVCACGWCGVVVCGAVMVANNGAHGMRAYSWGKRRGDWGWMGME